MYYKKHRSKSKSRIWVTGQKHLKESGIYTELFCKAVCDLWEAAAGLEEHGFEVQEGLDHHVIWEHVFKESVTYEETWLWWCS